MSRAKRTPVGLIVGPTPPPFQGVSTMTEALLKSSINDSFNLVHLDTTDRRSMANSGFFDFWNVYLALKHGLLFLWLLIRRNPEFVYVPVSQNTLGFLRDSLFMIPCRVFGIPLLIHLHGGGFRVFFDSANHATKALVRFCLRGTTAAIVLSSCFLDMFGDLLPREKVVVVENGIADEFGDTPLPPAPTQQRSLRVLYMGTLVESKGFVDVVHAAAMVLEKMPNVEFMMVGDGRGFQEADRAVAWVQERRLEDKIRFVGPKNGSEKRALLQSADLFAFPTWYPYEGQPLVLLEAMAAGLPIITTCHAAIEHTVTTDGAVFCAKQNPTDLADKLIRVLADEHRRITMGQANRKRFLQRYEVSNFAKSLEAVFASVTGRHAQIELKSDI
jgi:glycosyltransferase involved in cell wall biosynthesis